MDQIFASWLPTQQPANGQPQQQGTDDWAKSVSPAAAQPGHHSPPNGHHAFDLAGDFGMGDPGPSSSISPPPQQQQQQSQPFSYGFGNLQQFFNPYVQFTAGPWGGNGSAASTSQIPVSNYSSLNGATTSAPTPPPPQQQQSPPPHQQQQQQSPAMQIDPTLFNMNSHSNGLYPQSHSPSYSPPSTSHMTQFLQQYPNNVQQADNTHFSHIFRPQIAPAPQRQQQQPSQGTLSPQVLQSPSVPSPINPVVKKEQFLSNLRPLLQPQAFTGAGAVKDLTKLIGDHGVLEVEPQVRMDILSKIRDNAGNHYFRALADNVNALEILREWLKASFTSKTEGAAPPTETTMPLLQIIDRLPLNIDKLKEAQFGKIILRLKKQTTASPAVQDMASNLERRWRTMLTAEAPKAAQGETNGTEDKGKKRKPAEPPAKAQPPAKKVAVAAKPGAGTSATAVKKEPAKPVVPAVKDAKSDSSFFSAPKPKPKLPSFKKAAVPPAGAAVKKEPDANVAQPSSIDPFQEALKSMGKRRESPSTTATPPPAAPVVADQPKAVRYTKKGKIMRNVSWASEDKLVAIKLIERAVYDDDAADGGPHGQNLREFERGEGLILHTPLFEEAIDWSEPTPIDFQMESVFERGQGSQEKTTQEDREKTALSALYMTAAHIPDSPGEPAVVIPEDDVDKDVKMMKVGEENEPVFWEGASAAGPSPSVAELVSQLGVGGVGVMSSVMASASAATGQPTQNLDINSLTGDSIQQLLQQPHIMQLLSQQQQQQQQQPQGGAPPPPPYGGMPPAQTWEQSQNYSDYGYDDSGRGGWGRDGRGRGGRGRGGRGRGDGGGYRNNKRKPCSFFASGSCRYGDQCNFSHEL